MQCRVCVECRTLERSPCLGRNSCRARAFASVSGSHLTAVTEPAPCEQLSPNYTGNPFCTLSHGYTQVRSTHGPVLPPHRVLPYIWPPIDPSKDTGAPSLQKSLSLQISGEANSTFSSPYYSEPRTLYPFHTLNCFNIPPLSSGFFSKQTIFLPLYILSACRRLFLSAL
jgi:hypothetical protein